MNATFEAKGSYITEGKEKKSVIYGRIVKGEIEPGMRVVVQLNNSAFIEYEIENIEKKDMTELILKRDEDDSEIDLDIFSGLNINDELLDIK